MFHPVYILYELGLIVPIVYAQVLALLVLPDTVGLFAEES
jgi:hypothetical protein